MAETNLILLFSNNYCSFATLEYRSSLGTIRWSCGEQCESQSSYEHDRKRQSLRRRAYKNSSAQSYEIMATYFRAESWFPYIINSNFCANFYYLAYSLVYFFAIFSNSFGFVANWCAISCSKG